MTQQRYHIYVDRMTCANCAGIISKALTGLAGVVSVKAYPDKRMVDIVLDPERSELDDVRSAIESQGFDVRKIETA